MKKVILLTLWNLALFAPALYTVSCGPSREEIEQMEMQELMKKNGGRQVVNGCVIKVVDGCEYVQFGANDHVHKGNCRNPIHNHQCQ